MFSLEIFFREGRANQEVWYRMSKNGHLILHICCALSNRKLVNSKDDSFQ